MDYELARRIREKTDAELIEYLDDNRKYLQTLRDIIGITEMEITSRLESRNATIMRGDNKEVEISSKTEWDISKLSQLREMFSPDELEGIYTAEHEKVVTVPEKWNMARGRRLLKYGSEVSSIIDSARIKGRNKLTLKEGL
jgi:ribosome-interacting GTPase 1